MSWSNGLGWEEDEIWEDGDGERGRGSVLVCVVVGVWGCSCWDAEAVVFACRGAKGLGCVSGGCKVDVVVHCKAARAGVEVGVVK